MADPIAIIGLVSAVITFVDFGYKVVSSSKAMRASRSGSTAEIRELDLIITDIRQSHVKIPNGLKSTDKLSEDEKRIVLMVDESEALYTQLKDAITKLEVRADARSKTFESIRVAFQSLWSHNDIKELTSRLDMLDSRIRSNLSFALQLHQHSSLMKKLKEIQNSQENLGINHESKLLNIQNQILGLLDAKKEQEMSMQERLEKRLNEDKKSREQDKAKERKIREERAEQRRKEREHLAEAEKDKMIAFQMAQLASLKTKLEVLQKEHSTSLKYVEVVDSLYFPEVRRRFAQIPRADQRSNEWIFDPKETTFLPWLKSNMAGDGIFYIFGKAGSGKSTLMKYVSESQRTKSALQEWAGTSKLYTPSYYFWNQGSEMQKSRIGLLQSLLYQVLRLSPHLIPSVCRKRLKHEPWELDELTTTFDKIALETELDSKFCFFIDGLDEYDGEESEVMPMLRILSASPHIKVCASSRPGRIYEKSLLNDQRSFDIARFTREDMRHYVTKKLNKSEKFMSLTQKEPSCQDLVTNISECANGVWLWVFLVTRDIVYEVERDEPLITLQKIVNEFPADLEKYFQRIIGKIKDIHKEEMAQTFLVTTHELKQLPLYAFALLEKERIDSSFAEKSPIEPISDEVVQDQHSVLKSRVQNRCGDLLIVEDQNKLAKQIDHSDGDFNPALLRYSVDFLHRTVRDFLRDSFADELHGYLKTDYNPLLSLCRICLGLLKVIPGDNIRNIKFANRVIALTDEMLYYAHEVEKTGIPDDVAALVPLLDQLNHVNIHHAKNMKIHWTHVRDKAPGQGLDSYEEGGACNFLALATQTKLLNYVRTKIQEKPHLINKNGRPLLDYALRPRRMTPVSMRYHSYRDDPSIDVAVVQMLLSHGANPNEVVHLYQDETVWGLFLTSILEHMKQAKSHNISVPKSLVTAWYKAAEHLIKAGAQSDRRSKFARDVRFEDEKIDMNRALHIVFGTTMASKLEEIIEAGTLEREQQAGGLCTVM